MKNLSSIFIAITILFAVACKKETVEPAQSSKNNSTTPIVQNTNDTLAFGVHLDIIFNKSGQAMFNGITGKVRVAHNGDTIATIPYTTNLTYTYDNINVGVIKKGDVLTFTYDNGIISNGTNLSSYNTIYLGQLANGTLNAVQMWHSIKGQAVREAYRGKIFADSTASYGFMTPKNTTYEMKF